MNILLKMGLGNVFKFPRIYSRWKQGYYMPFTQEVDLDLLLECRNRSHLSIQRTATGISVFNMPFNCSFRTLKRTLGSPRYNTQRSQRGIRHDVFFYTLHIYNKKAIAQFHYFNKRFLLCNITFIGADNEQKDNILNVLSQKYSIQTECNRSISVDQDNNVIMVADSVNLNICYMNHDVEIIRNLLNPQQELSNKLSNYQLSNLRLQKML